MLYLWAMAILEKFIVKAYWLEGFQAISTLYFKLISQVVMKAFINYL